MLCMCFLTTKNTLALHGDYQGAADLKAQEFKAEQMPTDVVRPAAEEAAMMARRSSEQQLG